MYKKGHRKSEETETTTVIIIIMTITITVMNIVTSLDESTVNTQRYALQYVSFDVTSGELLYNAINSPV